MKPYYDQDGITIYHGDCREILPTLDKVDLVLTDPPYGINADIKQTLNSGKKGGKRGGYYKHYEQTNWDVTIPSSDIFTLIFQSSENQIVFGGEYMTKHLPPNRGWIIWDKVVRGHWPDGEMAWSSFDKGLKIYRYSRADAYINDIDIKCHPTQKPVYLFRWIVSDYTSQGDNILDPFMGSGTTLKASKDLNRKCIGIEIEEKYCEIAARRCSQRVFNLGQ